MRVIAIMVIKGIIGLISLIDGNQMIKGYFRNESLVPTINTIFFR